MTQASIDTTGAGGPSAAPQLTLTQTLRVAGAGETFDGSTIRWLTEPSLFVRDVPDEYFTDATVGAQIEMYHWRPKRMSAGVNQTHSDLKRPGRWRHPSNWDGASAPSGGRSRSGNQAPGTPPRISEWPLFGLSEYQLIAPVFDGWWRTLAISDGTAPFFGPPTVNVFATTLQPPRLGNTSSYLPYPKNTYRHFIRFRISINDPEGDGSGFDRLVGPWSNVLIIRPHPWPFYPEPANPGGYQGRNSDGLVCRIAGDVP